MSRARRDYSASSTLDRVFEGFDASNPIPGFYRHRLRSGAIRGGVRIWYGPPHDPVTGEEMDRSHRMQAEFNGAPIDLDDVWPVCAGEPITEADYAAYIARVMWAAQNAPNSSYANPRKRRDPLDPSEPLPF